jgi:hypothetical protein
MDKIKAFIVRNEKLIQLGATILGAIVGTTIVGVLTANSSEEPEIEAVDIDLDGKEPEQL